MSEVKRPTLTSAQFPLADIPSGIGSPPTGLWTDLLLPREARVQRLDSIFRYHSAFVAISRLTQSLVTAPSYLRSPRTYRGSARHSQSVESGRASNRDNNSGIRSPANPYTSLRHRGQATPRAGPSALNPNRWPTLRLEPWPPVTALLGITIAART